MKNILLTLAGLAAAVALAGCDDTFSPKLEQEGTLKLASVGVEVDSESSRAGVDVSAYIVTIEQGAKQVASYKYSEMPEIITLPVGSYTIQAKSHTVEKAAWSAPYYLGSQPFAIQQGKITEIGTIVCKFASVAVTIAYEADLLEKMADDCKVTVVVNDDGKLVYTKDEARTGYFEAIAGSTTMVVTFSGTVDENKRSLTQTYSDVAPGSHYTITYSLHKGDNTLPVDPSNPSQGGHISTDDPASGISIDTFVSAGADETINGDADVSDEEQDDVVIDPGEEPGQEDPEDPGTGSDPGTNPGTDPNPPTPPAADTITFTTSPSIDLDKENPVTVPDAVVYLHSDKGFAHLNVVISSDNDNFLTSAGELMPLSFDLATITGDDADYLESVGLPVGPYGDVTTITFDVSDLVVLLGGFPGHHEFGLTVIDPEGAQKSITLKFVAE